MSNIDRQTETKSATIDDTPHFFNQPLMKQIEAFLDCCRNYDELYIYGAAEGQVSLARYLKICGMNIKGFLVSSGDEPPVRGGYPVIVLDASIKLGSSIGVILGLSDKYFNEIWNNLMSAVISEIIFIPEHIKIHIARKLRVRKAKDTSIEINLVDHCNLNCFGCHHYAQLAEPSFLKLDEFEYDIKRLSELAGGELYNINLMGGEPLLHESAEEFGSIARTHFPKANINYYTNGLLLDKMKESFWTSLRNNDCTIQLTRYPVLTDEKIKKIRQIALENDVHLDVFSDAIHRSNPLPKQSLKFTIDISGNRKKSDYIACVVMNRCTQLRKGKLFQCATNAKIEIFNHYFDQELAVDENDYINIHKAKSWDEVARFLSNPVPFCKYCDIKNRSSRPWRQSQRTINEYIADDLVKNK